MISAKPIAHLISLKHSKLNGLTDQDAHEVLTAILGFLHDDLNVSWEGYRSYLQIFIHLFLIISHSGNDE